ncbi:alcohol dehydrogenase catalytic domain-containing protein [Bryobacter aggregatus]|uniref:alcohol dehydrogenase catalytic domain-containing protein n=1 Tax=Bryobacter aggregatus TaxID=360054 RepID=UPI0012BAE898|nr:alcohol dehydrogenase catalytic domain-containing protein [Bryobacter aggregatus]
MKNEMLAAVLYGKEHVEIEKVAVPQLGDGDVLVRVRAALTCGTDVKVFHRGYHARMIVPPALFGHELAGDVVEVGKSVRGFRPGQRVVAANSAPCGECFYCKRHNENLCENLLFNNGAYAEFIRIPSRIVEKNLYEIPEHVAYQDAALVEPLACVIRGIDETGVKAGDTVVVIGVGPIGLMFVRLLALRNCRVIAVGRRRPQLDRAAQLGAHLTLSTNDEKDIVAAVRRETAGYGADVVIEAVGLPETWQQAIQMLRRGGVANFFGGCPADTQVCLDTQLMHYSEITCTASFHHTPAHVRKALEAVVAGYITAYDFVTGEEPLSNLNEVLTHQLHQNGAVKTAIIP